MGRHESFDPTNAIPFSLGTMGGALPAPGSPEALEAFGAACRAVDAASRLSDVEMEALSVAPGGPSLWTSDKATEALSGNFSRFLPCEIEAARATPRARLEELQILALRRELRMAEAARSSRIRELHALVYGDEPNPADEDEAPTQAGADPLLAAMVAEWQDVRRKLNDPSAEATPELDALADQHSTRQMEIYLYPARSALDLLAKVPVLRDELEDAKRGSGGDKVTNSLPITAWTGLLADIERIAGTSPAQGPSSNPDPILAAIEASRAAQAAVEEWGAAIEARASPLTEADFADEDRLNEAQSEARSRVIDTVPTTPTGRLALLEFLRWQMGLYGYTDGAPPDQGSYFWRFAYKSLAAALAWGGPAAVGEQEASADAALIALGRAFDAATVLDREANDALNAAEDRAEPHMPERPVALFYRDEDAPFRLRECGGTFAGAPVYPGDIEWMIRRPAQHEVWVDDPNARPGWSMVPGKKPRIVPWPEAQARIDEIAAAWDAWHAEQDRVLDEAGVTEAREATVRTSDAAAALARQIAAQPARTVEGMQAKLRVAAFYCVCDPDTPEGEGYPGEAAIRSLYRDTPGIEISTNPSDVRIVPEAGRAVGADLPADIAADLLRELEECDRLRTPLAAQQDDTPEDGALYQRHWDLRERIDALPPGSPSALRVKAYAGLIALKWDEDASNTGTGSFLSLATQVVTEVAARPDLLPFRIQTSAPEA